jgi:hypothetical protein
MLVANGFLNLKSYFFLAKLLSFFLQISSGDMHVLQP